MFEKLKGKHKEKTMLQQSIDDRIELLSYSLEEPDKDEKAIENLERLTKVKAELEPKRPKINPNTVISLAATVGLGIITIKHEQFNVITSKFWNSVTNMLPKFKQ